MTMADPVSVAPWHPYDNPECTNCNGLSKPVRKKKPCKCPLVQLRLNRMLTTRKMLRTIVFRSELPQEDLAQKILGMNATTLWRLLKGKSPISDSTASQLNAITHIQREGSHVHVIYDIGTTRSRWDSMLKRRRRNVVHMQCVMQGEV